MLAALEEAEEEEEAATTAAAAVPDVDGAAGAVGVLRFCPDIKLRNEKKWLAGRIGGGGGGALVRAVTGGAPPTVGVERTFGKRSANARRECGLIVFVANRLEKCPFGREVSKMVEIVYCF